MKLHTKHKVGVGTVLVVSAVSAQAAVPEAMTNLFTTLVTDTGTLLGAGVVLFAAVRGGTAVFKIASKFFGAAGA